MYCQRADDGSCDVSVFVHTAGFIACQGCELPGSPEGFHSTAEMIAHLREHEAVGHVVPEQVYERLEREQVANDAYMTTAQRIAAEYGLDLSLEMGPDFVIEHDEQGRCHVIVPKQKISRQKELEAWGALGIAANEAYREAIYAANEAAWQKQQAANG